MARAVRVWPLWLLAGALGASSLLFWWRRQQARQPAPVPAGRVDGHSTEAPAAVDAGAHPAPPGPALPAAPDCTAQAKRRCVDGDAVWFDSCGERAELAEECGLNACDGGQCARPDPLGCDEPITGRCAGDTVRTCFGGTLRSIDCAARGLHCVLGAEGAECRPDRPGADASRACLGSGSHCDGDVRVRCVASREQRLDCTERGARCVELAGEAQCALPADWVSQGPSEVQCAACGCTPDPPTPERCNGEDDDGDGLIDEDLDCGPISVRALVVGEPGSFGSYTEDDIESEISRVNAALGASAGEPPLRVELVDVVWLDRRAWLTLDDDTFQALARGDGMPDEGAEPAIPVLFTDEVVVGDVPKPGVSTLPNGTCGGSQRGRGPDVGLVAVSKTRSLTTVAHEIGHFLGLCHTHEAEQASGVRSALDENGHETACEPSCRGEGDGVCDTPLDPGPGHCPYNSLCQVFCPGPEAPDVHNLMSYYTDCRLRFTDEQVQRMRHTLALRKRWHACRDGRCACAPGEPRCPVGMACRPFRDGAAAVSYACSLEGPARAGNACDSSFDCERGTYCVATARGEGRCARSCGESAVPCDCQPVNDGQGAICRDDLR